MPKKKKTTTVVSTTIPINSAEDDLRRAADDLGITVIDLEAILELGQTMRELIIQRELSPQQVISATINLLGETIQSCIDPSNQIECCSALHAQLLSHLGKKIH